ncbi:MAG: integrase zinc binding domain-containing protein, partial [Candidatus Thiodiazotropha sp.]
MKETGLGPCRMTRVENKLDVSGNMDQKMDCVDVRETTPHRPEEETACEGHFSCSSIESECVEESSNGTPLLKLTRGPTEKEMYGVPGCPPTESPMSFEVKNRDSAAENANSFKCVHESVPSGYVRDIHCSEGNSQTNCENDPEMEKWKKAQVLDPVLSVLYKWLELNKRPDWEYISDLDGETKTYLSQWSSLILHKGVICRKYLDTKTDTYFFQILVPSSMRDEILIELHDHVTGGHLGSTKTMDKVRKRFYWCNYKEHIENWCKQYVQCQSRRLPKLRPLAPMKQNRVGVPMERVSLDLLGPFPESRKNHNKYILSICDQFTRWVELYP